MDARIVIGTIAAGLAAAGAALIRRGSFTSLNTRIANVAVESIGLGAHHNLEDFEDLLGGPGEAKSTEEQMALSPKSSTCGLAVGGIWRRAGIRHPKLAPPYHVATAIARLVNIGDECGAVVKGPALLNYTIQPGDTLLLDIDKPNGHVNTVAKARRTATGWECDTVDGGGVDSLGGQEIQSRVHTLTRTPNGLHSVSNLWGVNHNVWGIINVSKLQPLVTG